MSLPDNAVKVFSWKIFDVYQWEQEMYDWTTKIFEKLKRNDTVDVLAITNSWEILILEEIQPWRELFYWLVWGTCENSEKPIETAKRELFEETWYKSEDWSLFNSYSNSSKIDYKSNLFIAKNCKKISEQNLDWWEKIFVKKVNWDIFLDVLSDKRFRVTEFALDIFRKLHNWKEKELKELFGIK